MKKKVTSGTPVPPQTASQNNPITTAATPGKTKTKKDAHPPAALYRDYTGTQVPPNEFSVWRSTRQILEEFPVSEKSLYNWRMAGILPFGMLGRKIMYNRTVIERILMSRWNVGLLLLQLFLNLLPDY